MIFKQFIQIMPLGSKLSPADCKSKEEIREQIDIIDHEIITLFAKRFDFVKEIVKYKDNTESVIAIDRKTEVINQRAMWAHEMGLDRMTFEKIYTCLIDNNINKELEILQHRNQDK